MKHMILAIVACILCGTSIAGPVTHHTKNSKLPVWHPQYKTTYTESYTSGALKKDELNGVQCPIPMENRVRNHTGVQCVFSSLEMLARWAECKRLLEPEPLTSRPGCKSYSGPNHAAKILAKYGVKFENVYRNQEDGIRLIKKAMAEHRGALFGVPGHAMVMIHYDEEEDVVKWVDNSDTSLRIQTMTVRKFKQRWDSWVMVIYADKDIIPYKMGGIANKIPIIDRNNPQGKYPIDYIPIPKR